MDQRQAVAGPQAFAAQLAQQGCQAADGCFSLARQREIEGMIDVQRKIPGFICKPGLEGLFRGGEIAASAVQQGSDYVVGTVEQVLQDLAEAPDEEDGAEGEAAEASDETPVTEEE